jgi:hypothetical protein
MEKKYHKIRNVSLRVCAAEQMIAYNLAQAHSDLFKDEYTSAASASAKNNIVNEAAEFSLNYYTTGYAYKEGKYNIDCISDALRAGMGRYMEDGRPILSSYESIGAYFPANCL